MALILSSITVFTTFINLYKPTSPSFNRLTIISINSLFALFKNSLCNLFSQPFFLHFLHSSSSTYYPTTTFQQLHSLSLAERTLTKPLSPSTFIFLTETLFHHNHLQSFIFSLSLYNNHINNPPHLCAQCNIFATQGLEEL
ncbi:unnamed protein product [Vicia faba]|uniref:Uncharacterized protein n=1 Tax=Vicia faba TaxID=3906 RepID=A0AAV1AB90_VICFA|nr:unnamed protein product [Vicia faba]